MAKERAILHCDMNCFYASCEMAYHPELQDKPIAVCGDPERRSGIVLTASYPAKRMGVKTGMPLWEAQQHCRDITFVPAHYDLYTRFSGYTREIFLRYTDQVEPFGLDEAWLDCTASQSLFGTGEEIAKKISDTVKDELGITCSVGVSWNKTMAKLGSDFDILPTAKAGGFLHQPPLHSNRGCCVLHDVRQALLPVCPTVRYGLV